jgi:FixJ family two-component response regulator
MIEIANVFIVDDDDGILELARRLAQSIGLRAETYSSAHAFLASMNPDLPGCLILDLRLPDMNGLALQQHLIAQDARWPLIFITGHGDVSLAASAFKAGAFDFLEKPFAGQQLLDTMRAAVSRDKELRARRTDRLEVASRLNLLTRRESEVLNLIVTGMGHKEIGSRLGISSKTVDIHCGKIRAKTRTHSETALVRLVLLASDLDLCSANIKLLSSRV